ncbi:MAG: YlxR family protein [Caldimicrobium sp.]
MAKNTHLPERTCVSCRKKTFKAELFRFVVKEGNIIFDEKGNLPGRGAYLCGECFPLRNLPKIQNKLKKALRLLKN